MSAQVSFSSIEHEKARPRLTLVPQMRSTISTVGFALIIMTLVALGMGVVMVVTTSVAAQSKELSTLRVEATQLDYRAAALTTELQRTSSTAMLAFRASELGMAPNTHPAFIRLSDGAILGDPQKVTGNEAPYLTRPPKTPAVSSLGAGDAAVQQSLPVAAGTDQ
ncbi:MAG: hypothetical protein Q4P15_03350 [Propionibacteriaceae bacterium]|nr:hypothetical protein [Propionibacteriaceae bacterium]